MSSINIDTFGICADDSDMKDGWAMKCKLSVELDFFDALCDWDNIDEVQWVHKMLSDTPLALFSDEVGDIIADVKLLEMPVASLESVEPIK